MNLELFQYIDDIIDLYESKQDMYKLITEDMISFFREQVFSESKITLNITSRLKSADSIREKLLRNNYISKFHDVDTILENFQDLIGLRIECKFIDDEKYVFSLLPQIFSETTDNVYFYSNSFPKIKLKLSDPQPQKQKNGFDIYKIDGIYMLSKEPIRFELQIMALVNSFWGEIEHKIIYKNNNYLLSDNYVTDLMTSIKKSLIMIDEQLYVLYSQFRKMEQGGDEPQGNSVQSIERFISKMVYDVFFRLMRNQVGFTMDFRDSCDTVVRYILAKNGAEDVEDYSRIMLNTFNIVNAIEDRGLRVDAQFTLDNSIVFMDPFCQNVLETVRETINSNYKWHIFFVMLFSLEWDLNEVVLKDFIRYYKSCLMRNRTLTALEGLPEADGIREDILSAISEVLHEKQRIEMFSNDGIISIHRTINLFCAPIRAELLAGNDWLEIREGYLNAVRKNIQLG